MDALLPGHEIVDRGLADLARGDASLEALLVSMAPARLRRLGFDVPAALESPEQRLYELLAERYGDGAHSKYNAYRRRLLSFLRTAECAKRSTRNVSDAS